MPISVLEPTAEEPLDVVGDRIRPLIEGPTFELFDLEGPAESGPPPHAHPWDEAYLIVEGSVLVGSDEGELTVGPGHRVVIPAGTLHWYRIVSPTARFFVMTSGSAASAFFRDMDASVPPGPPTDDTMPLVIEVAKRNRLTSPLF